MHRYERDLGNQNKVLTEILTTIKLHDEFISEIKPVYLKGMIVLGAAVLGSVGIAVTWFWHHIRWG